MCSIFYFQGGQMSGNPTSRELAPAPGSMIGCQGNSRQQLRMAIVEQVLSNEWMPSSCTSVDFEGKCCQYSLQIGEPLLSDLGCLIDVFG